MKRIKTFLVAAAVAATGFASPAGALQPPPGVYYEIMYYSDPGMSNLIGHWREYCDGHYAGWGGISEYSYQQYYEC